MTKTQRKEDKASDCFWIPSRLQMLDFDPKDEKWRQAHTDTVREGGKG